MRIVDEATIDPITQSRFKLFTSELHDFFHEIMNYDTSGDKKGKSAGCILDEPNDPDVLSEE